MQNTPTRRSLLRTGAAAAAALAGAGRSRAQSRAAAPVLQANAALWPISLNTSTLRGHKLPITETIAIAARTGYAGIEPWPDEIERYLQSGGTPRDLGARIRDLGLKVTGAIAFYDWMVDDDAARQRGLEQARVLMERFAAIGATHLAAPPAGKVAGVDLLRAAERYRRLLELSADFGITPALEIWGFAENLNRLGQTACVAIEADHPKACILPDIYHLYKGGSGFSGIGKLRGSLYAGFHLNDIPKNPPPLQQLKDSDRIYPGDGIVPFAQVLRDLNATGYRGAVSIELFNPEYYRQDPELVARTALEKTRAVIQNAMA